MDLLEVLGHGTCGFTRGFGLRDALLEITCLGMYGFTRGSGSHSALLGVLGQGSC